MKNKLSSHIIEFHIAQSFPVSTLNRDDVGAPKTAVVGGVVRARVSSQAWKRQIRFAMQDLGAKLAYRSKKMDALLADKLKAHGVDDEKALKSATAIMSKIGDSTILFISDNELERLANRMIEVDLDAKKIKDAEFKKLFKNIEPSLDGLDIALFGRMVAKVNDLSVEGATSYNHPISTHIIENDIDFFTAVDDFKTDEETGSAHLGANEFNSATYYRYISINLGVLAETLFGDSEVDIDLINRAIDYFTKALFIAVPFARQNTLAAYCPWDFAKVYVRKGQNLQLSFDKPVTLEKGNSSGYSEPTIQRIKSELDLKSKISGSLFGEIASFEIGQDPNYNIDNLVEDLKATIGAING